MRWWSQPWLFALALFVAPRPVEASPSDSTMTPLCRDPDVSRTQIVFVHRGELWLVPREGGTATRLTVDGGPKSDPRFSPDGSAVAFVGRFNSIYTIGIAPGPAGNLFDSFLKALADQNQGVYRRVEQ